MAKFKFNDLKFEQIMKRYADARDVSIPDAVMINARLLCVELARRTQPFGLSDTAKKTGEMAITRDLLGKSGGGKSRAGLFAPISAVMDDAVFYKSSTNVRLFVSKDGNVYGTDRSHFLPDATENTLRAFHKKNFVNGRMSSAGGKTKNIGRWKFVDRLFVDADVLNSYLETTLKKVGIAKSGWASCASQLKKINKGSLLSQLPNWVTRHLEDFKSGAVEDRTSNKNNPTVILTNKVPWASEVINVMEQVKAQSVVAQKMKKQMEKILKGKQSKLIEA
jgi:hypothetical protein